MSGFDRSVGQSHGFLYTSGSFTTIDVSDGLSTEVVHISNAGRIVGQVLTAARPVAFTGANGRLNIIDVPGATTTQAFGVNNAGEIVGVFLYNGIAHGFLDIGGSFTPWMCPGPSLRLLRT